jgi:F-type H+-transporting ATPase subunit b
MAVTPDQIHAASVHVPADSGPSGLPQFDIAQWPGQAVWILFIFAVMLFLFTKVFVPAVGGTIAAREDRIAGDIGAARRMKAEADAQAAAAVADTAQARARAQKLALDAKARAQAEAAHADALEQSKLAEQLAHAEVQIVSTRDRAMRNVRQIALDAAGAIVEKLTGVAPTAAELGAAQARGDA